MIMGIDPAFGKPSAFAVFNFDRVHEWGFLKSYEHFQEILMNYDIKAVFIEDQYYSVSIANPEMFKKLAREAGILQYIANGMGYKAELVMPKSWMSAIDIPVNATRGPERDRWIIALSKGLICRDGFFKLTIDEACAIQIAWWGARHEQGAL